MTYDSQYEDRAMHLLGRAQKIKTDLGGAASSLEPFPLKPKGIHRRTHNARRAEFDIVFHQANLEALARFGPLLIA